MVSLTTNTDTGPVWVVTGASSGIGRAIALELAAPGASLCLQGCSNFAGICETADLAAQRGAASRIFMLDLSDPTACHTLVQGAFAAQDRVDGWIHVAGADVLTGSAAKQSFVAKLERLWRVDVQATILCTRLAGEQMRRQAGCSQRTPTILTMGWDQADSGMEGDSGQFFAATKGAVMAFTRSLAKSLGPDVRVNCIAPGWIQTLWGKSAPPHWDQRARGESMLGRWGTAEDIARVAKFLLSPESQFLNGQVVSVNGGWKPAWPAP